MPDLQDNEESEFISPDITSEDEEILTETMVNIYIKQGRYEQALKILRKICLNNPKKNAYFANQIDLLEVITEQK
jgi:pentatricopeptide repeat protein